MSCCEIEEIKPSYFNKTTELGLNVGLFGVFEIILLWHYTCDVMQLVCVCSLIIQEYIICLHYFELFSLF